MAVSPSKGGLKLRREDLFRKLVSPLRVVCKQFYIRARGPTWVNDKHVVPGDVLLAEDTTGTGHEWRLVNDEPWKRVSVVFRPDAETHFVAEKRRHPR
jgi:hypothetical protein